MYGNVYKSEEGWIRFRERTNNGANKRQAFARHSVRKPVAQSGKVAAIIARSQDVN